MKKFNLKINYILKYWNYLNFLRINGIFVFCQNLSLNAKKELEFYTYVSNSHYKWKKLNKKISKLIINKHFLVKIKKFNNILIIKNINDISMIETYLKKKNILILGYYIQNIFFFKKDFKIYNIEKKSIVNNIRKRIINFYSNKIYFIIKLKYIIIKLILLLKKIKNVNN